MDNSVVQYRSFGRGASLRIGRESSRRLRVFAVTFVLYVASSLVAFAQQFPLAPHSGQIAILWPANPVLVSMLLIVAVPDWPVVGLAALVAHLVTQVSRGTPPWLMGVQFGHNGVLTMLIAGALKAFLGS